LNGPEHELDLYQGNILNNEQNSKQGKDEDHDYFVIHQALLLKIKNYHAAGSLKAQS